MARSQDSVKRAFYDPLPGLDKIVITPGPRTDPSAMRSDLSSEDRKPIIAELEKFLAEYPDQGASLGFRLADLYFREGRNADAYRLLAPLAVPDAMPELLLRASIAASMRGEVYPGQRQYCLDRLDWLSPEDLVGTVPRDDSAASMLTLSYLATASDTNLHGDLGNAEFYAERVVARDARNPLACQILGQLAMQNRQYAKAAELFTKGLGRARGRLAEILRIDRSSAARLMQKTAN